MSQPLLSIIIPCYNDGIYVAEAVASAKAQRHANTEVIVVDDYSTEAHTMEVLRRLASQGVRVIRTCQGSKGLPAARNTGIAAARGVYILPLDADDKIHPDYGSKAVALMEEHMDTRICTARVRFFGLRHCPWPQPECSYANIVTEECKVLATSVFRRADWERVGGYDETLTLGKEDMVFWLDILSDGGQVATLSEEYIYYRVRPHSMTAQTRNNKDEEIALRAMLARRPDIFRAHVGDFMHLCAQYREEKAHLVCLISWKCLHHLFQLEWWIRQKIKKLFGRA